MKLSATITAMLAAAILPLAVAANSPSKACYKVVPLPKHIEINSESEPFKLSSATVIISDSACADAATLLRQYIQRAVGIETITTLPTAASSIISLRSKGLNFEYNDPASEAYTISVTPSEIILEGVTPQATLRGVQTLRKSLTPTPADTVLLPAATISDQPDFAHRGAHFDVSRHFFPADSVMKFLDMMALHNLNRFHWHLTDDQGWRLPVEGHENLTKIGAYRKQTVIGDNSGQYDGTPYSGAYSPEDIVKVRQHASMLGIEIIPEVDMPGHMQAALATYPELGCTGGPYEVWEKWGVSDDVLCAGNPQVYKFIEDVITSLITQFPESHYIHVGGDECPKTRWKNCPKCQAKIQELGLINNNHATAEQRLQSHVIMYADSIIRSHGRTTIGWNEILEGGIGTSATIHAWTGENAGVEAARKGHQVVMSPTSHMYFDYYQTRDRSDEPIAFNNFIPLRKVYNFYPIPKGLTPDEGKLIVGVQANLWTEYVTSFPHAQYMELPRMAALAEVGWGNPNPDYQEFLGRLDKLAAHYRNNALRYATHVWGVDGTLVTLPEQRKVTLSLITPDNLDLKYSLTGPEGELYPYTGPVDISSSANIYATTGINGRAVYRDSVSVSKVTFLPIEFEYEPHPRFTAHRPSSLTDSRFGSDQYSDGNWIGFIGKPMVATIEFPQPDTLSEVSLQTCVVTGDWIMDADSIEVEGRDDSGNWSPLGSLRPSQPQSHVRKISRHEIKFPATRISALRLTVAPLAELPEWHSGSGYPAFIMVDEISAQ